MELILLSIIGIAFFCEFIDSTLGMGYGTSLTPILLLMGFEPLQVVPAVLFSEFLTGITAGLLHNKSGNVSFDFANDREHWIVKRLGKLGYLPKSRHSKVAFILGLCSMAGTITAVLIAVNISKTLLKIYIGLIVLLMGIVILARRNNVTEFSWKKIIGLGTLASFNKGMSGGGYGPLVTSGQILSGLKGKNAVAITSLAEGMTCLVGIIAYYLTSACIDWTLAPYLAIGALMSTPLSVNAVKRINEEKLTTLIGTLTILLGALTLYKIYI